MSVFSRREEEAVMSLDCAHVSTMQFAKRGAREVLPNVRLINESAAEEDRAEQEQG